MKIPEIILLSAWIIGLEGVTNASNPGDTQAVEYQCVDKSRLSSYCFSIVSEEPQMFSMINARLITHKTTNDIVSFNCEGLGDFGRCCKNTTPSFTAFTTISWDTLTNVYSCPGIKEIYWKFCWNLIELKVRFHKIRTRRNDKKTNEMRYLKGEQRGWESIGQMAFEFCWDAFSLDTYSLTKSHNAPLCTYLYKPWRRG